MVSIDLQRQLPNLHLETMASATQYLAHTALVANRRTCITHLLDGIAELLNLTESYTVSELETTVNTASLSIPKNACCVFR
jgi:hypothetical protein